ncbi:unnamed protein product [Darwinula stevensoni]|uniref:Uncharacterized protein n=1 Tax=Darwinula stevensoni TaxID=69355 RepID=A0A7R8XDH6_9CRUS|nr:unnamed protein product [Darwinula stevensoni]CAG0893047.1 unnamed protein product [Darwinula stevensoni]
MESYLCLVLLVCAAGSARVDDEDFAEVANEEHEKSKYTREMNEPYSEDDIWESLKDNQMLLGLATHYGKLFDTFKRGDYGTALQQLLALSHPKGGAASTGLPNMADLVGLVASNPESIGTAINGLLQSEYMKNGLELFKGFDEKRMGSVRQALGQIFGVDGKNAPMEELVGQMSQTIMNSLVESFFKGDESRTKKEAEEEMELVRESLEAPEVRGRKEEQEEQEKRKERVKVKQTPQGFGMQDMLAQVLKDSVVESFKSSGVVEGVLGSLLGGGKGKGGFGVGQLMSSLLAGPKDPMQAKAFEIVGKIASGYKKTGGKSFAEAFQSLNAKAFEVQPDAERVVKKYRLEKNYAPMLTSLMALLSLNHPKEEATADVEFIADFIRKESESGTPNPILSVVKPLLESMDPGFLNEGGAGLEGVLQYLKGSDLDFDTVNEHMTPWVTSFLKERLKGSGEAEALVDAFDAIRTLSKGVDLDSIVSGFVGAGEGKKKKKEKAGGLEGLVQGLLGGGGGGDLFQTLQSTLGSLNQNGFMEGMIESFLSGPEKKKQKKKEDEELEKIMAQHRSEKQSQTKKSQQGTRSKPQQETQSKPEPNKKAANVTAQWSDETLREQFRIFMTDFLTKFFWKLTKEEPSDEAIESLLDARIFQIFDRSQVPSLLLDMALRPEEYQDLDKVKGFAERIFRSEEILELLRAVEGLVQNAVGNETPEDLVTSVIESLVASDVFQTMARDWAPALGVRATPDEMKAVLRDTLSAPLVQLIMVYVRSVESPDCAPQLLCNYTRHVHRLMDVDTSLYWFAHVFRAGGVAVGGILSTHVEGIPEFHHLYYALVAGMAKQDCQQLFPGQCGSPAPASSPPVQDNTIPGT